MDDTDEDFRACAIPTFFQIFRVSTLNYSDQLLHLYTHGIMHNRLVIIWIADATMMMSKQGKDLDKMLLVSRNANISPIQSWKLPAYNTLSYFS